MKPFASDDLLLQCTLQGLDASPSHDAIVFVHSRADRDSNSYRSTLRLLRTSRGDRSRRLTTSKFNASSPKLAPAGAAVAFLSSRDDAAGMQVHLLALDGGEARQVSHSRRRLETIEGWSADGKRLLLTARIPWAEDPRDDTGNTVDRPKVVNFLPWKQDGKGATVGFRTVVLQFDVASGAETVLVEGDFDASEAQWSPDGQHLAFIRYRSGRQRHRCDAWLARADGSEPRQLTDHLASVSYLRWSPDSLRIAFSGSCREGDSLDNLYILDLQRGQAQLTGGEDLQLESGVVWHGDGRRVAAVATRRGLQEIVTVDLDSDRATPMHLGLRHVGAVQSSGDRLVFIAASLRRPEEIYTIGWDGSGERRHSAFNRKWFGTRTRPRVSKRTFQVRDGEGRMGPVDAWLLRPARGDGPFPLLLDLHGGPHSAVLIDYASQAYWYELCSHGWAILAPNAIGSSGYGPEFARRLRGRWGELDLPQHLGIIDTLQREGIADHRLAVTGKSYGGYLTAWAIGHTDRFKAAVVSAPLANLESHAGTSDTGFYVSPYDMGGEIGEMRERYEALSPVRYAPAVTTPTLFLQGEDDRRCPLGQSEEMFARLVRCSKAPAQMVVYPGGSHALAASGKPGHRVDYHRRLVDWLRCWGEQGYCASRDAGGDTV